MEKRLYTAAEVSKDTSAAFFLKVFDRDVLMERLAVMYACSDVDDLPRQELAERWLRMLPAGRLKELADKVAGQFTFGDFSDDVTDAIDDTLYDVVTKNAEEICTRRSDGMVGYLFPWQKDDDRIDGGVLYKAGFVPDISGRLTERDVLKWCLDLFLDTPMGRFSYCRIRLDVGDPFLMKDPLYNVDVDFEHPAADLRKRFDNKVVGARYKRAAHGVLRSGPMRSAREAFDDVSDRFMQKREEILGILREISPEEFV